MKNYANDVIRDPETGNYDWAPRNYTNPQDPAVKLFAVKKKDKLFIKKHSDPRSNSNKKNQ